MSHNQEKQPSHSQLNLGEDNRNWRSSSQSAGQVSERTGRSTTVRFPRFPGFLVRNIMLELSENLGGN